MAETAEATIMIVDDDPDTRAMIEHHLANAGYDVHTADGGEQALRDLADSPVDLVISDIVMPHMTGLTFRRKLMASTELRDTPFIFLTARPPQLDRSSAAALGVDEPLAKPLDPDRLLAKVRSTLDRYRAYRVEQEAVARLEQDLRDRDEPDADIQVAAKIQQMLLLGDVPTDVHGLHAAALTIPSELIDGDFFEFIRHSHRCVDIIVGDVMGKGVPAALVGAAAKSEFLRGLSQLLAAAGGRVPPSPEQIVMAVHHRLTPRLMELESFVTLCYARVDLDAGRLDLVDCGHTKTILLHRETGEIELLAGGQTPLGVAQWELYRQLSRPLEPTDALLFYSDGVTEARNRRGELFGAARLIEIVGRCGHLSPDEIIETIRAEVAEFVGADTFSDDLTCLAVEVQPTPAILPHTHATLEMASDAARLGRLRRFIRQACRDESVDAAETLLAAMERAAVAAASRIIRDAYEGAPDRRIRAELTASTDRIEVALRHWGRPLDDLGSLGADEALNEANTHTDPDGTGTIRLVKWVEPAAVS